MVSLRVSHTQQRKTLSTLALAHKSSRVLRGQIEPEEGWNSQALRDT